MKLYNTKTLLEKAKKNEFAIPAFNIHNLEMVHAVLDTALEERSPVIIQTTPGTLRHIGIPYIGGIMEKAVLEYDIPIALHLDHCQSFEIVVQCINAGYSSVMIDGSHLPYHENVKLVKEVVKVAKAVNVSVEGELGRIGGTEDDIFLDERKAALTIPEEAVDFAIETEIDSLAVAIGTAHGLYKGKPELDFERLRKIRELVLIPLVLHGASGVPDESIKKSIKNGICKVNIATDLKIPMAETIKECLISDKGSNDPRKYMDSAKKAVMEVVRNKIALCNSAGKAGIF